MKKEPRTIVMYGETGSSKTTQLAMIAKYLWETKGKKSRLISCDGGGSKQFYDMGLVDIGAVEVFMMARYEHVIANLFRLSKGYWPRLEDGKLYFSHVERCMTTQEEFNELGAYLFDSMTGMAEILIEHVSNPDRQVGSKLSTRNMEDGYQFGTLDKTHYNIVQKELRKAFEFGFNALPIDYFVCTARVAKGESTNRLSSYGPEAAGQAITSSIPSWFNDCYFLEGRRVKIDNEVYDAKVAWFKDHLDENTSIPYPAKARCVPKVVPELDSLYPYGYCVLDLDEGIVEFLNNLDKLSKKIQKVTSIASAASKAS